MIQKETVYFNNRFMEKIDVKISPDDRGFLFGDGIYEVIRTYDGNFFELNAHFERLERSLQETAIHYDGMDELKAACRRLLADNGLSRGDATVYIQITRGAAKRKHYFPDPPVPATVYAAASRYIDDVETKERGGAVILSPDIRWNRCDIKTVSLLPNAMGCQAAREAGVMETIFVRDGAVTEGTRTNFAAVFDGALWTHPECQNILSGVTRSVVLTLCRENGIPVREYPVLASKLAQAREMMLIGTTTEVTPVISWDGKSVGNSTPGPITRRLQNALNQLTRP